ncbi:MAG: S-methyl-5-thioribose-1-phosphate isomerase [Spirochaetes bacterium]|nr:S-methyl-5-thioribose-1-phosphate isomerase [Spirochaetota bacterium]
MKFDVLKWDKETRKLKIIDQTLLPIEKKIIELTKTEEVIEAIKKLKVRGAPLIGVAAGFGAVISYYEVIKELKINIDNDNISIDKINNYLDKIKDKFLEKINLIKSSRPTAYNMFFILDQIITYFNDMILSFKSSYQNTIFKKSDFNNFIEYIGLNLQKKAQFFQSEDESLCEKIGEYGINLINDGDTILTHCNAGSLATSAWGTALAPIYKAFEKGYNITVYCDETRPLLQGARLTSYELNEKGINTYVICDNMAGYLMQLKKIDKIIVGADRICKNGDFANKIGTYSIAVLAKYHNIPFYVAAPYTTFDLKLEEGKQIPIEERDKNEIIFSFNKQIAPLNINVFNPAFDITPNQLVSAFITDKGIFYPPYNFEKLI